MSLFENKTSLRYKFIRFTPPFKDRYHSLSYVGKWSIHFWRTKMLQSQFILFRIRGSKMPIGSDIYLFKVNNRYTKKVWNRFKVNNINTITTSLTSFWCVFIVNIPFSIVSIVEFEEENVSLNDFKYRQIIPSRLNDWYIIVWQTPPLQTNDKCYPAVILITLYIVQSTTL